MAEIDEPEGPEECDCEACRQMDQKADHDAGVCGLDCPFCQPLDYKAGVRRALNNGKGTCRVCEEVVARDDLTLCFHIQQRRDQPYLKVICLACRKDKRQWHAWSHTVPG